MTRPKRLAIVHYHLLPGGVTRVISHAATVMSQRGWSVVILCGRDPEPYQQFDAEVLVLKDLYYHAAMPDCAEAIAAAMLQMATDALGGEPDVWHAHNHSLGKNAAYPAALRILANRGHRLMLQIHDFAEDSRPHDYRRLLQALGSDEQQLGRICYPIADHVHYAVLNSRDHQYITTAGLDVSRIHLLPNAVQLPMNDEVSDVDPALLLYPTRGIRRKNIGEFILWSALAEQGQRFAITLAPTKGSSERSYYDRWMVFAKRQQLPVEFEFGACSDKSFTALLSSASALVTTSIAEGFGLAFLEPLLVGRPVVGRNLPVITDDFSANGIDLKGLYQRLDVPIEWVGADILSRVIATALDKTYQAYGRPYNHRMIEQAIAAAVQGERVDFGHLDESMQERVIKHICQSPSESSAIRPGQLYGEGFQDASVLANNRQIIETQYGLDGYGHRLEAAYVAIGAPSQIHEDSHLGAKVLDTFLNPDHFLLLRA